MYRGGPMPESLKCVLTGLVLLVVVDQLLWQWPDLGWRLPKNQINGMPFRIVDGDIMPAARGVSELFDGGCAGDFGGSVEVT